MTGHSAGMTVEVWVACLYLRDESLKQLCSLVGAQAIRDASLRMAHRSERVKRGRQPTLGAQAMQKPPDHQLTEQEVFRTRPLLPQHATQLRGTERQAHPEDHAQDGRGD